MDEHALAGPQGAGPAQARVGGQEDGRHGGGLLQGQWRRDRHQGCGVDDDRGPQAPSRLAENRVADPMAQQWVQSDINTNGRLYEMLQQKE